MNPERPPLPEGPPLLLRQTPLVRRTPILRRTPLLRRTPRILSIAGTDPTGGAGIQADLKSIAANGGYGMAAVTALVAQNTLGVRSVHTPPAEFLRQQLDAVSDDVTIDAVKIGMLADVDIIGEVRSWLLACRPPIVVLDPVMIATSGDRLLQPSAEQALRELIELVDLVTPNVPELARLLGEAPARDWAEALEQGTRLATTTGVTVLVKGGHFSEELCPDALVNAHGVLAEIAYPRVTTANTHGTGCSLSAAMATVQARTGDWMTSLTEVKTWLQGALVHADELEVGRGNGPIHHFQHLFADTVLADTAFTDAVFTDTSFTDTVWRDAELVREQIFALPFITALDSGALSSHQFQFYLEQDALYLATYSQLLDRAGELAPTAAARQFWAESARGCREVELELHRKWLDGAGVSAAAPVTSRYLAHLVGAGETANYAVLVAALLPCFWLYSHVGDQLHARHLARASSGSPAASHHPYREWIETYADEAFAASTRQAIALTDDAAATASKADRTQMRHAFYASCEYERDFFDAPSQQSAPGEQSAPSLQSAPSQQIGV